LVFALSEAFRATDAIFVRSVRADCVIGYTVAVGIAGTAVGVRTVTLVSGRFLEGFLAAALLRAFLAVIPRTAFLAIGFDGSFLAAAAGAGFVVGAVLAGVLLVVAFLATFAGLAAAFFLGRFFAGGVGLAAAALAARMPAQRRLRRG
jgi:hypothetical protein